jgi:Tfp pilus assembly protein PilE
MEWSIMGEITNKKGFTIIELLIVGFIFTVVMFITYKSVITYSSVSKSQENLLVLDQNIRITLDIIARHIRMAGFGTKYSLSYQTGNNVNYYYQVFTANDGGTDYSDTLTVVYASRFVGTITKDNNNNSSYSGNKIYITSNKINLLNSTYKRYIFITSSPYNQYYTLASDPSSLGSGKYLLTLPSNTNVTVYEGDNIYAIRAITLSYNRYDEEIGIYENTGSSYQALASDIESLQFQYGIDENNDGTLDDTDNDGNGLDNTVPQSKEKFLKVVKVSILVRAPKPDPKFTCKITTYHIANQTIRLDTNDNNGINSKCDWHYRRKLIQVYITPRNYKNELF